VRPGLPSQHGKITMKKSQSCHTIANPGIAWHLTSQHIGAQLVAERPAKANHAKKLPPGRLLSLPNINRLWILSHWRP